MRKIPQAFIIFPLGCIASSSVLAHSLPIAHSHMGALGYTLLCASVLLCAGLSWRFLRRAGKTFV